jgi:hypothetical protein
MPFFMRLCAGLLLLCFVRLAYADAPDAYYARHAPRRSGEIMRIEAAADFVWNHAVSHEEKRDLRMGHLSAGQKHLACSLAKILPDRGGAFVHEVASHLTDHFGISDRTAITRILTEAHGCPRPVADVSSPMSRITVIPLDAKGIPVSRNPVWNACVRGQGLSFDFIQSNTDRFEHRSGRLRVTRPWSCRDYHRGKLALWKYPDQPHTELLLDRRGKFLGAVGSSPESTVFIAKKR